MSIPMSAWRRTTSRTAVGSRARKSARRLGPATYSSCRSAGRGTVPACETRMRRELRLNRRPLGVSASGLAIMSALADEEVARIVDANAARVEALTGHDRAAVLGLVKQTRRNGYALNAGYSAPGMAAVAVAVRGARGEPFGSLCVAALADRLGAQRCETVVRWLTDETEQLRQHLNAVTHGLTFPLLRRSRPR